MTNLYVQYPDLTEIRTSCIGKYKNKEDFLLKQKQVVFSFEEINFEEMNYFLFSPDEIKTEFAFCTTTYLSNGTHYGHGEKSCKWLKDNGFIQLSMMLNWWPSHWGDGRHLDFWWKKLKDRKPQVAHRYCWGGNDYPWLKGQIAATGCGFKIGHFPLHRNYYYRFFSLLRLYKKPNKLDLIWLKKYNYRKIDEGTMAEYWLNGWPVDEYTTAMEEKFWRKEDPDGKLQAQAKY